MKNLSVLIVDDNPMIGKFLESVFSMALKWETIVARANGDEALEAIRGQKFDLLFTDRTMPGMNGEDLIWRVKLIEPGIKIIMMTGDADFEEIRRIAINEGADEVLRKPSGLQEIINAVNKLFLEN